MKTRLLLSMPPFLAVSAAPCWHVVVLVGLLAATPGCARPCADVAAGDHVCRLDGYTDRPYLLHVPTGAGPFPLVFYLHGGGGKADGVNETTCEDGDLDDASCFLNAADAAGVAVVMPNGTAKLFGNLRTWNAGGGGPAPNGETWRCSSGKSCEDGVDDVAYIDAVLEDVRGATSVGEVYSTGISNGAAMSHRLACERASVFSAIAPVSGANQLGTSAECVPDTPVAVLQIHGTADPCWPYDGGNGTCFNEDGILVDVASTMASWALRNGCTASADAALPDAVADGMTSTRTDWSGCAAPVSLVTIDGGGHTWPGGEQYMREGKIGPVTLDYSASVTVLDFFAANRRD